MVATISLNPVQTTNALGSFGVDWTGGMQGTALADPASRYYLSGGVLAASESLPMWGGVGLYEDIPASGYNAADPSVVLGAVVGRATQIAAGAGQLAGFSVFDQNYSAINSPQSPVPLSGSYQSIHYYRFGTNARVWLACDPAIVSLYGDPTSQPVSWDFNAQQIIPYVAAYEAIDISSATYTSSSGQLALVFGSSPGSFAAGDYVTLSGITPASLNGSWEVVSASGDDMTVQATVGLGSLSPSGGQLNAGGGAIPIRSILRIESGNSMTVEYSSATNTANWNRSGTAALVLL